MATTVVNVDLPVLTAMDRKVFASKSIQAYHHNEVITNDMVYFENAALGDTVIVPEGSKIKAKNKVDGVLAAGQAPTEQGPTIDPDIPLKAEQWIPESQVTLKKPMSLQAFYQEAIGIGMAEGRVIRLINLMSKSVVGVTAQQLVFDALTLTGLGGRVASQLIALAARMTNAGIPDQDRNLILEPVLFYSLLEVEGVQNIQWGGQGNVSKGARSAEYAGFVIGTTGAAFGTDWAADADLATKYQINNNAVDGLGTALKGVAWHKNSVGVRHLAKPLIRITYHDEFDSYLAKGRHEMGTKVLRGEGVWALLDDGV